MILTLLLQFFWLGGYFSSPYLFPGAAAVLYFFEFDSWFGGHLDLLTAFPVSLYYLLTDLQAGQRPKHPGVLTVEFLRWLLVLFGHLWGHSAQRTAMMGYSCGVFINLVMKGCNCSKEQQVEWKYRWYLFWLIQSDFWSVFLHGLNFMAEFRLVLNDLP